MGASVASKLVQSLLKRELTSRLGRSLPRQREEWELRGLDGGDYWIYWQAKARPAIMLRQLVSYYRVLMAVGLRAPLKKKKKELAVLRASDQQKHQLRRPLPPKSLPWQRRLDASGSPIEALQTPGVQALARTMPPSSCSMEAVIAIYNHEL